MMFLHASPLLLNQKRGRSDQLTSFSLYSWHSLTAKKLYTFLETTMDTIVLLPSFINFFDEAKNHSSTPANLAIIFLAFGKLSTQVHIFFFSSTYLFCILIAFMFLTDSVPWCSSQFGVCSESSLFPSHARISSFKQHNISGGITYN